MQTQWTFATNKLVIRQQDLTLSTADAIVNAANPQLAGGGGVDGAIHTAAGPQLLKACQRIVQTQGELPPGKAVITAGYTLPAQFVIHTVGPIWHGGINNEPEVLTSSYTESIRLAHNAQVCYLAFPAISCGVYGYPPELGARIALQVAIKALKSSLLQRIDFCLYNEKMLTTWLAVANQQLSEHPE